MLSLLSFCNLLFNPLNITYINDIYFNYLINRIKKFGKHSTHEPIVFSLVQFIENSLCMLDMYAILYQDRSTTREKRIS